MDGAKHSAGPGNNIMIIGPTVDGSGHITREMVADWLTRLQQASSRAHPVLQSPMPPADVDSVVAEQSDVVVEVQEFVPEEEITVVESGEVIRSKASGKCDNVDASVGTASRIYR